MGRKRRREEEERGERKKREKESRWIYLDIIRAGNEKAQLNSSPEIVCVEKRKKSRLSNFMGTRGLRAYRDLLPMNSAIDCAQRNK